MSRLPLSKLCATPAKLSEKLRVNQFGKQLTKDTEKTAKAHWKTSKDSFADCKDATEDVTTEAEDTEEGTEEETDGDQSLLEL